MQIKIKRMINKITQIEVIAEAANLEKCIFQVAPIINAPKECGLCKSAEITIESKVAKKDGELYQYISYLCSSCGAKQMWGQYKQPQGCYFLKDWVEKYNNNHNHE